MKSSHWAAVVVLAVLSGCSASGEHKSARTEVDSPDSGTALLKRLKTENVNYECEEVPLGDVFKWFSMQLDLEFEISAEIRLDHPITISLYRNTIAAALDRLCLRYDLVWKLDKETIIVEVGPMAQSSAELLEDLRRRKYWIACEETTIEEVFGNLRGYGVPIETAPEVEVNIVVSLELPTARLYDLLCSLTTELGLRWTVYGGAVHIEKAK